MVDGFLQFGKTLNFLFQVVLSCVEGSPAARAGIHVGDELVEINGMILIWDNFFYLFYAQHNIIQYKFLNLVHH